jgi:hypothetical protein
MPDHSADRQYHRGVKGFERFGERSEQDARRAVA